MYKLSTETNEKPFKLSSESTGADSPLLIEKEKIRFIKKNTLVKANALSTVRLHTRIKIISPPERTTNTENSNFFEKKNLTTAASFPKVQTVNSFPIDDFSILSFRKESTPNIKKTNTQMDIPTDISSPLKTEGQKSHEKEFFQAKTFSHRCYKSKGKLKVKRSHNKSLSPSNIFLQYPKYPSSKYSSEPVNLFLKSYAVNSYRGLVRNYNEDKVSIILSITKPKSVKLKEGEQWPVNCSFFGIYDGYGGSKCCNFLRDNLHNYIIRNKSFPRDPEKALQYAFERAEKILFIK